jgi:hypothetical protein
LLAGVFVFIASSVIHMCLPIHKNDFGKLPNEEKSLAALRALGLQPGAYRFPCAASMKEMGTSEFQQKMNQGPVGVLTLMPPGPMAMGKYLAQWFVFCLVVCLFAAYVGGLSLTRGAEFQPVFRLTTTVAFLGFAFSSVSDSIWKGVSWAVTAKFVFDGLVYALVAGATFAWLWPSAS